MQTKRLLAPKELFQESDQNNFFFHKSRPVHTKPLLLVVNSFQHFPALPEVLACAPPAAPSPLPEIVSKHSKPFGTSLKKSKKHQAIALVTPRPPPSPQPPASRPLGSHIGVLPHWSATTLECSHIGLLPQ